MYHSERESEPFVTTPSFSDAAPLQLAGGGVTITCGAAGDGNALFRLYAPGKTSVSLIGSFNHWNADADPMQVDERGIWSIEKRLPEGRHEYRYLIDGTIRICDPYAPQVTCKLGDEPQAGIVIVGEDAFAWQYDEDWGRPPFRELVVYEMHVLDFSPEGTFQGVINGLDYLQDLGITAIELMPVNEFAGEDGGETSWGYDPMYFFALHPAYGTPKELKLLVDEAHARGIAIILDVVLAHTSRLHPFMQMYEWKDSPWYGMGLGEVNQFGFPMLDYSKAATEVLTEDILIYWLSEYHVDGFRFDYAAGIGTRMLMGLPHLVVAARKGDHHAYLIAEYLPEEHAVLRSAAFDGAWHGRLKSALWALLTGADYRDFSALRFREATSTFDPFDDGYTEVTTPMNYVESHDEERLAHYLSGLTGANPEIVDAKLKLAATVLMTLPGVPMLYQGQEWGEDTEKQINRPNPLHWERRQEPAAAGVIDHYRRVTALRRDYASLCTLNFDFELVDRSKNVVAYRRFDGPDEQILVVANFSPVRQEVQLARLSEMDWMDCSGGTPPKDIEGGQVILAPYSAQLYRSRRNE